MSRSHSLALAAACLACLILPAAQADSWEHARAAKALFTGTAETSASARIGNSRMKLPAKAFPCARCHGRGGGGGGEGVTQVPAISWNDLTRASPDRPAYDEKSFIRALEQGVASDGRALDRVMPRYTLADPVIHELIAHLRRLPFLETRGISADSVEIRVLHDADLQPLAADFKRGFEVAVEQLKPWGRDIFVATATVTSLGKISQQLHNKPPFLLAGLATRDPAILALIAKSGLPVMTPILRPQSAGTEFWHDICLGPNESLKQLAIAALTHDAGKGGGVAIIANSHRQADLQQVAQLKKALGAAPEVRVVDSIEQVPVDWPAVLLSHGSDLSASQPVSLYGLAEQVGHRLDEVVKTGNSLSLVDPCPPLPMQVAGARASRAKSLGFVSGQLVAEAIRRSGRALTRSRFAAALLEEPFAFSQFTIDYARFPDYGTGVARLIRFRAQ